LADDEDDLPDYGSALATSENTSASETIRLVGLAVAALPICAPRNGSVAGRIRTSRPAVCSRRLGIPPKEGIMRKLAVFAAIMLSTSLVGCDKEESKGETSPASTPTAQASAASIPVKTELTDVPLTTTNPQALAACKEGLDLVENARISESVEKFAKALELDPKFTSALALRAFATPGPDGEKALADAVAQAGALPEAERVYIQVLQAVHAGDRTKSVELSKRLVELAPKAWRSHFELGFAFAETQHFDEAAAEHKKSTELAPNEGAPYNGLAYAELFQGKTEDAIAHLKRYAELRPKEPNPQDSLGEALLNAGRFDEAEAAYKKALEISPKFAIAWQGVAFAKAYRGDWAGALDAFNKFHDGATQPFEKIDADFDIAMAQLAQGKGPDALKSADAADKDAAGGKYDEGVGWAGVTRATIQLETGKGADALKTIAATIDKVNATTIPDAAKTFQLAILRSIEATADARANKKDDAQKAATAIQALSAKSPGDGRISGKLAYAQGEAALAGGDPKTAVQAFAGCQPLDDWCRLELFNAQNKAGDKPAAAATRDKLSKATRRDGLAFYVHSKIPKSP
jgi:Flp pilus assembly protein TadD